ncbi:amino acid adenylation domain-containing protein, partial [Reyranella sp. CPCC 100927]|uniref:amino acid adenylation domain-containing protein n=1 Tax=Reyranella sp. CPCC 100927 TaxID=2599616 RepID=UPI0011B53276
SEGWDEAIVADQLAYVIYTSGSTGRPKGVGVTHGNLSRLLSSTSGWYGFGAQDVWTLFHAITFDFSVWEVFGSLVHGGRLVVVPYWTARDAEGFHGLLRREGVTVLNQTPSAFWPLLRVAQGCGEDLAGVRVLIFGGEKLEPSGLGEWLERRGESAPQVVNMYGITETTVHVSYRRLGVPDVVGGHARSVIGEALGDLSLRVLDSEGNEVPAGGVGELHVGGAGLGRGYLGRGGLTADRFVPDPHEPGGRLYRTGDVGRRLGDGDIEYLGRADGQVKIRGYRIELGEIEAALRSHAGVREAVAVVRGTGDGRRLAGYVVGEVDGGAVRTWVSSSLPEYMVPSVVMVLEALPLTPNGKLDRNALPEPEMTAGERVAPRTSVEAQLARVWRTVLKRDDIGVTDDFFALGGDSILSLQIVARARREGLRLTPRQLFERPTIEHLAQVAVPVEALSSAEAGAEAGWQLEASDLARLGLSADDVQDVYPATPLQQGLLFHSLLRPGEGLYVNQLRLRLEGTLDDVALRTAWQSVVDRHAILRTRFTWGDGGEARQIVLRRVELPWTQTDWRGEADYEEHLAAWRREDIAQGFALDAAPPQRVALFCRPDGGHDLVWTNHHALTDGWSTARLLGEVVREYTGRVRGETIAIEEPAPYRDYVSWLSRQASGEDWWRAKLGAAEEPAGLLESLGRSSVVETGPQEQRVELGEALTSRLKEASRRGRVTLNTLMQGAWALLLARYGGRGAVRFGVTVSGRPAELAGVEGMVGLFINSLPLWLEVRGETQVGDWLRQLQAHNAELRQHEHVGLGDVQRWAGRSGEALFDTLLVFENYPVERQLISAGALKVAAVEAVEQTHYLLTLAVLPEPAVELRWSWDRARLTRAALEQLSRHYVSVLEALVEGLDRRVGEIELSEAAPKAQPLAAYAFASVTARIGAQASVRPEAEALSCEGERLSYGALEAWSNRIGRRLKKLGVGREVRVGLCLERSVGMVAGLLGVLKAGGAFVPLDPAYPEARLREMVQDAGVRCVVTDAATSARLGTVLTGCAQVVVDDVEGESAAGWDDAIAADQLAYVIYTSGSTGRPKGVAITHGALSQHIDDFVACFTLTNADRVLQFSTINFDAAMEQLLPVLTRGGTAILRGAAMWGTNDLNRRLMEEQVTLAYLPTAYWQQWLGDLPSSLPSLRQVTVGGEALAGDALKRWQDGPLGHLPFANTYGPTEATITVSAYSPTAADEAQAMIPIGQAWPARHLRVLDVDGNAVPVGGLGELCIGGGTLARGYLDRPGLTAERFVPDPHMPGDRLYRTGDLCRQRADGTVEFLGRLDEQVKLRGFRIELGEVEAGLRSCAGVREAVAVVRGSGEGRRLVGYVVGDVDGGAVKAALSGQLPEYLVPSVVVVLPALPVQVNGKVDRRALPEPTFETEGERVAPRSAIEARLVAIWRAVLKRDDIGVTDDFFALGGDSILSLQIVAGARRDGLRLTPRQVFECPTIERLAPVAERDAASGLEEVHGWQALTPIQASFFARYPEGLSHWNQAVLLRASGEVDVLALERALAALVVRHDALRLRFGRDEAGDWQQRVEASEAHRLLSVVDLRTEEDWVSRLSERGTELQASLDLSQGPLLASGLFLVPGGESRLLLAIHHLAVDGVSWRVLLEDLQEGYGQAASGRAVALPPVATPWSAWARRLSEHGGGAGVQAELAWWRDALSGARDQLPVEGEGDHSLGTSATEAHEWDEDETRRLLRAAPRAYRLGVDEVLLTALSQTLGAWSGGDGILVDLEGHGREALSEALDVDVSRTVGWFTTRHPVWLAAEADAGVALRSVKERLRSVPGKGSGWGLLQRYGDAAVRDELNALPRPGVSFNYLGQFDQSLDQGGPFGFASESGGRSMTDASTLEHVLDLNGLVAEGRLRLSWRYSPGVLSAATVAKLMAAFEARLRVLVEHCESATPRATGSDYPRSGLDDTDLARLGVSNETVQDVYPATPLQQGLLAFALRASDDPYYVQHVFELAGPLSDKAFQDAWHDVVARHAMLRTRFCWEDLPQPLLVVRRQSSARIDRLDWRQFDAPRQHIELTAAWNRARVAGFNFDRSADLELQLIQLDADRHWLVWRSHHAQLDGWSMSRVLADTMAAYAQRQAGKAPAWRAAPSFREYHDWLQRQDGTTTDAWWQSMLADMETATPLPASRGQVDAPRPYAEQAFQLDASERADLEVFAGRRGLTLNTLVQGAWAWLLSQHAGDNAVTFGVTMSGRPADVPDVENIAGLFINTLPLRVTLSPGTRVGAWLQDLQQQNVALRQHAHVPLSQVQALSGFGPDQPLFESILVFDNYPLDESLMAPQSGGLRASRFTGAPASARGAVQYTDGRNHYPLSLIVEPGEGVTLTLAYGCQRFDHATVRRLLAHLVEALRMLPGDPDRFLGELTLPSEDVEPDAAVQPGNDILSRVAAMAAARGAETALVHEATTVTWAELWAWSGRLAGRLRVLGVEMEAPVAACLPRSPALVASILAIWRAGGTYVPLDPALPADRLAWQLQDCGARWLIAETAPSWPSAAVTCVDPGEVGAQRWDMRTPCDSQAAYVIYTSGSTGRPKGVVVSHGALEAYVRAVLERLPEEIGSAAYVSTPAADLGHTVLFGALWSGWTLHLISEACAFDPDRFGAYLTRHQVDALKIVPSHLGSLLQAASPQDVLPQRCLIVGGEATSAALAAQIAALKPQCRIVNHYGPTETTVGVLTREGGATSEAMLPLGRPLAHGRVYVLDVNGNAARAGVAGEICIGGEALARGYVNRPELTAERFVPDPYGEAGRRLYRTGDRGRYLPTGEIEFLGRLDDQVKIRGYRVEPEEVAVRLRAQGGVASAVVVARPDQQQRLRLLAYVVGKQLESGPLRAALAAELPEYMVPSAVMVLDALPLTPNGKLDRNALPEPEATAGERVAPRTAIETQLAGIWRAVLKRDDVGVTDDFFALGGDSILSLQIVARARREGLRFTPRQLFDHPTIEQLALLTTPVAAAPAAKTEEGTDRLLQASVLARLGLSADAVQDVYPATPLQQGLLFHSLLRPGEGLYVNQLRLRLEGTLDVAALRGAWQSVVDRHAILRTRFTWSEGGDAHQIVLRRAELPWTETDWREAEDYDGRLAAWRRDDVRQGFALDATSLQRVALFRRPNGGHDLVWTNHHVLTDGWSTARVLGEVVREYTARVRGEAARIAEPAPYRDYVSWLTQQGSGEDWWRTKLGSVEDPVGLLESLGRPAAAEAGPQEQRVELDADLADRLREVSRLSRVTLNTVMQGAWALLLSRYGGRGAVRFGVTVSGRPAELAGVEGMVGLFINSLPLWVEVRGETRVGDWLRQLQDHNAELRQYEHAGLGDIQRWVGRSGEALFDTLLVFHNHPIDDILLTAPRELGVVRAEADIRTHYPLTLTIAPTAGLALRWSWDGERMDRASVERLSRHYVSVLKELSSELEQRVGEIALSEVAAPERALVRYGFAAVTRLITAQAQARAAAEAVSCGDDRLSYGGLEAWSNRIGRRLKTLGVGREVRV